MPSPRPCRLPLVAAALLAVAVSLASAARADERAVEGDSVYTIPAGFRQAPADAITAVRALATAFYQAADPTAQNAPFGRGFARGTAQQPDLVVVFAAAAPAKDDHGDVALSGIELDSVAGAWAGGLGKRGLSFAPDPVEVRRADVTWALGSASYARADGSQRRVRVALGRRGRHGLLLAIDAAANQETAVRALWQDLIASTRIGRDAPDVPLLERYPAIVPAAIGLAAIGLFVLLGQTIKRRRKRSPTHWSGPKRDSMFGLDLRGLTVQQLRGDAADTVAAAPRRPRRRGKGQPAEGAEAAPAAPPSQPRPRAKGKPRPDPEPTPPVGAVWPAVAPAAEPESSAAEEPAPAEVVEAVPVETPAAPGPEGDLEELARRLAEVEARAQLQDSVEHAAVFLEAEPPPPLPTAKAAKESKEAEPAAAEAESTETRSPPKRVLPTPVGGVAPVVARILRNDDYLAE